MSGLVGYGSSSEDEKEEVQPNLGTPPTALPQDVASTTDEHLKATSLVGDAALQQAGNSPVLLGPQPEPAREAITSTYTNEPSESVSPYETEREAILRLTAPTVSANAIPSSPPGSPNPAANARFARFLELKSKGVHFNEDLARKSSFSNPSLFSTMLKRAGLEEQVQYATSLPTDLWNVMEFPDHAYYEHLGKYQEEIRMRNEEAKKTQSAAGKRVLEFVPQSSSAGSSSKTTPQKDSRSTSKADHAAKKKKL